jgi:glycosyltransferase involved in cell wall biosynthesis
MKQLTICIPCFNEEENIQDVYSQVKEVLVHYQSTYQTNIMFIDNDSTDNTRAHIAKLCQEDKSVLAIFNAMNFGFVKSQFYGLTNAPGDAVILMAADLQDPPSTIPTLVKEWEAGAFVKP